MPNTTNTPQTRTTGTTAKATDTPGESEGTDTATRNRMGQGRNGERRGALIVKHRRSRMTIRAGSAKVPT